MYARFEVFSKGKITTDVSTSRSNCNFRIKKSPKKVFDPKHEGTAFLHFVRNSLAIKAAQHSRWLETSKTDIYIYIKYIYKIYIYI